uniref:Uncharacterized protein n=1 Tax=Panagrolaimus sp. ES5 TaxID=591445 RepID=A0AC34FQE7_9BILA
MPNLMMPQPPRPPSVPSILKLRDNIGDIRRGGGGASAFGGNIFEGVKPIEPMKDDPQRLTAFQGYNPLRQLASRFGFDTNKIPDPTTLNMLKRFLGPKMPNLNFGTKIAEFNSNIGNGISQNLQPIKPVNDFERVYKEESLKRMFSPSMALSSSSTKEAKEAAQAFNGEILKNFASVIQLPSNSPDPQLPFRQKNLDFAYQNALSTSSSKQ